MPHAHHILKVSRLENLSDGIFAIAMTILILGINVPLPLSAVNPSLPTMFSTGLLMKLLVYAGSFIILGTLWIAMNFQLGLLERVIRPYLWTNVFYLMIICIVPFSASLLSAFPNSASITFFAINLLLAALGQALTCETANHYNLNNELYTQLIHRAILRRIMVGPVLYVAAIIVAQWNAALGFILLVSPPLIYIFPGAIDHYDV